MARPVPGSGRMPAAPSSLGGVPGRIPGTPASSGGLVTGRSGRLRDSRGRFMTGGNGIEWIGLAALANNINRRGNALNRSRQRAMEKLADEMEAWMKENATWEDRTGEARYQLQTTVSHNESAGESVIYAGHGPDIDYGVYLETMQAGRFAIILPAIEHFAPRVMGEVREVDEGLI